MKITLLNDRQRNAIIAMVKPTENDYFSRQNLNLLTAVYDEEKNVYLTITRYMSAAITRTDDPADEYSFALLTPIGCFSVRCRELAGKLSGIYSPCPLIISGRRITEMIEYYRACVSERRAMEKEAVKAADTGNMGFTEWYLKKTAFAPLIPPNNHGCIPAGAINSRCGAKYVWDWR